MSLRALQQLEHEVQAKLTTEKNSTKRHGLTRVKQDVRQSSKGHQQLAGIGKKLTLFTRGSAGREVLTGVSSLIKSMEGAIPLEQLKGDIMRQGYNIQRVLALDPEGRRLFFTDPEGNSLYAQYSSATTGFTLERVGHQREIVKEYDVQDLKEAGVAAVVTTHEEADQEYETPGMIPGPTPGDKPVDEEVLDGQGEHASGQGWSDDKQEEERDDLDKSLGRALKRVGDILKQPPHQGLVPQSGDPQHPGRWIRPSSEGGRGIGPGAGREAPYQPVDYEQEELDEAVGPPPEGGGKRGAPKPKPRPSRLESANRKRDRAAEADHIHGTSETRARLGEAQQALDREMEAYHGIRPGQK